MKLGEGMSVVVIVGQIRHAMPASLAMGRMTGEELVTVCAAEELADEYYARRAL